MLALVSEVVNILHKLLYPIFSLTLDRGGVKSFASTVYNVG